MARTIPTDNAGVLSSLNVDDGTLYVDSSNDRVGVGLTDPGSSLHIKGSTPALVVEDSDGSNYTFAVDGTTASGVRWHFGSIADLDAFMTCGAYDGINRLDTSARDFHIYGTNTTAGFYFDESAGTFGFGTVTPCEESKVTVEGPVSIREQANAGADVAAYGQLWVKNATPNELWFTDDAGTDTQLGAGGGGGASANDSNTILHMSVFA